MNVYVVITRTEGTSGFDWFYSEPDAKAFLAQELEASRKFQTIGERYEVGYGRMDVPTMYSQSQEAITRWIDEGEWEDLIQPKEKPRGEDR